MFSHKITVNSAATPTAQQGLEKFSKLALALALSATLAACGSDGDDAVVAATDADGNVVIVPDMAITVEKPSLEAGESTDIAVRFTNQNNDLITETIAVTFSSNCLSDDRATIEGETSTTDGTARVTYTPSGCVGADELNVSAAVGGTTIQSSATITIDADSVLSVQFISAEPAQLAIKGTGGKVESRLTFQLTGQQGAPIIGESVTFSLQSEAGGVELARTTDVTRADGQVSTVLKSGTVHTTATVIATHDATGEEGVSDGISISSGVPLFSKFSLSAGPRAVPEAFNTDGVTVSVSIIASDQFGNDVPDGTEISFASPEFGNIDSACTLESGECSVTWRSAGVRPLDGRFQIIAYTIGAEDFTDVNSDGVFGDDDTLPTGFDLPEAFVDEDGNAAYNAPEFFVDSNENNAYDGGDGMWNGPLCEHVSLCSNKNTTIFKAATIVLPDNTVVVQSAGSLATFNSIVAGQSIVLGGYVVSDSNGNSLPAGTTINFSTDRGQLQGANGFVVKTNEIDPNGPFSIRLKTDANDASESGTIEVKITTPSGDSETFFYDFNVTP